MSNPCAQAKIYKVAERNYKFGYPGDLGKHHLLLEEFIDLKVLSIHQDEQVMYPLREHTTHVRRANGLSCAGHPTEI